MRPLLVSTLAIALASRGAPAQDRPLTLAEAFRRADAGNSGNRGARALADAQGAGTVSAPLPRGTSTPPG